MTDIEDELRAAMIAADAYAPNASRLRDRLSGSQAPPPRSRQQRLRGLNVIAVAAAAVLAVGLGGYLVYSLTEDSSEVATTVAAESPFPAESTRDWASFADHLVVGHVVKVQPLPVDTDDGESDRGFQLRTVSLTVDSILWSRSEAPKLADRVEWVTLGWNIRDGERVEVNFEATPRLEVGSRFMLPLVQLPATDEEPVRWSPLSPSAVLLVNDHGLDDGNGTAPPNGDTWVHRDFLSAEPGDVAEVLAKTEPYPAAAQHMSDDALTRVELVEKSRSR